MSSVVDWINAVSGIVSAAGILGAGFWFFEQNQRKQRVQFDLECRFFPWPNGAGAILAEVWLVFENKGFVEHRLHDLRVSVHVDSPSITLARTEKDASLWLPVVERESIVPAEIGYYFVRPGVHQVIRHVVMLPSATRLMRVTASFDYYTHDKYPHTARRIFDVAQDFESQAFLVQRHSDELQLMEREGNPGVMQDPAISEKENSQSPMSDSRASHRYAAPCGSTLHHGLYSLKWRTWKDEKCVLVSNHLCEEVHSKQ
ncbi:MAG: hypothetical protein IBJ03_05450 [Gemmatimonadaceae bacterium]|nr:hypothetical protein [Gemmatimonadaceae bacterium]